MASDPRPCESCPLAEQVAALHARLDAIQAGLNTLINRPTPAPPPGLLTPKDVAARLRVSATQARRLRDAHKVEYVQIGKARWVMTEAQFQGLLNAMTRQACGPEDRSPAEGNQLPPIPGMQGPRLARLRSTRRKASPHRGALE